jgi:hypothetical protein
MPVVECAQACTVTLALAPPDFQAWGITPQNIATAFGFGLGSVLSFWCIGWVAAAAKKVISAL